MEILRSITVPAAATPARPLEGDAASGPKDSLKLTKLTDGEDIEAFLKTFERLMEAYEVPKECWAYQLAPQLTGKAQQAYAAVSSDSAKKYDDMKTAILRRYNINEETYLAQFRERMESAMWSWRFGCQICSSDGWWSVPNSGKRCYWSSC